MTEAGNIQPIVSPVVNDMMTTDRAATRFKRVIFQYYNLKNQLGNNELIPRPLQGRLTKDHISATNNSSDTLLARVLFPCRLSLPKYLGDGLCPCVSGLEGDSDSPK